MKILLIPLIFLLSTTVANAVQNYQPARNPLNQEIRNPLKEKTDNRYSISQRCDYIEEAQQMICVNRSRPIIGTARQSGDKRSTPITMKPAGKLPN
ncbi:MAG: hypothetical protein LBQ34_01795 [Alphaproteobacteria bacterium]|jgi:hypothetical protein|nr:hypothetical protein [Alphaproteobacteria bacterium]